MNFNKLITIIILMIFSQFASADTISNTLQGADEYDWNTCIQKKLGECLNGCQTSSDKNCGDNCKKLSNDKCIAEGLSPTQ